jgi:hypothetical protein
MAAKSRRRLTEAMRAVMGCTVHALGPSTLRLARAHPGSDA